LPKLKGMGDVAETYADEFIRIEAVSKLDGELRMLDMRDAAVREVVRGATSARDVYLGERAPAYD
jgi:type III restriction enzyme